MWVKTADLKDTSAAGIERYEKIIYDPGVGDIDESIAFMGWSVEDIKNSAGDYYTDDYEGKDYTITTKSKTIKDVRDYIRAYYTDSMNEGKGIAEGDVLDVYAILLKVYEVHYLDVDGVNLGTEDVKYLASEETGTRQKYTVNMPYTVPDDMHNFEGWLVDPDSAEHVVNYDPSENEGLGTIYYNDTEIEITGDVTFKVNAPEGRWLVFDENGKGATYIAPQFILTGEKTKEPTIEMTRSGYTFDGWYNGQYVQATDEDGNPIVDEDGNPVMVAELTDEFVFGNTLDARTTVFAKWTANTTANYTVLIWKQNIAGDGYDFEDALILSGAVGQPIDTIEQQGQYDEAYATIDGTPYQYTGFHLATFDQNIPVVPEGSSVINLYYDRNTYVLTFEAWDGTGTGYRYTRNDNSGTWGYIDGKWVKLEEEIEEETTVTTYHLSQNQTHNDGYWGQGDTYSGTIYSDANGTEAAERTYPNTYYRRTGNWWSGYEYHVLYWHSTETTYTTYAYTYTDSEGNKQIYRGPRFTRETVYGNGWRTVKVISAKYEQDISGEFPIQGDNGVDYTGYVWDPQNSRIYTSGQVPSIDSMREENTNFHAMRYGTGTTIHMYYYVEALEGDKVDTTYGGKNYTEHAHVEIDSNGGVTSTKDEDFYDIDGYSQYASSPAYGSDGRVELNWDNYYTIRFYYERKTYPVNYMDGVYVSGNDYPGNVVQHKETNRLSTSERISYGANISAYGEYIPDLPEGEAGYVFEGWFADKACQHEYNFNTGMPLGGVTVYAKWRQIRYRVFLHPNAENDETLNWGSDSQEMNFGIAYGGKVSTPTGTRNGQVFVGWYTDEACTKAFNGDAFVLNDTTVPEEPVYDKTVDMTDPMDKFGNVGADAYNSDAERFWVTRKLDLYGKWRATLDGAKGINIVYDPVDGTNEPKDEKQYVDKSKAIAAAASTAPSNKIFLNWVLQTWTDTGYVDTDINVFPGDEFTVLKDNAQVLVTEWVNPNNPEDIRIVDNPEPGTTAPDETHTKIKTATYTVQLRAEYGDPESLTNTHIAWYGNGGTTPEGGEAIVYTKEDGAQKLIINKGYDIEGADTFSKPGFKFLGWARMPESAEDGTSVTDGITIDGKLYKYDEETGIYTVDGKDLTADDLWLVYNEADNKFTLVDTENTVSKVAADEKLVYHGLVAVWEQQMFTFTITKKLTGAIEYITIPEDGFNIDVTFTGTGLGKIEAPENATGSNGTYSVKLKVTEKDGTASAVFNVPAGIAYEVEESGQDSRFEVSYQIDDGTATKTAASGTITAATTVKVTNDAPKVTPAGLALDTTAAKTALLSLFAFAMMCVLGFSLKRRYVSRR